MKLAIRKPVIDGTATFGNYPLPFYWRPRGYVRVLSARVLSTEFAFRWGWVYIRGTTFLA